MGPGLRVTETPKEATRIRIEEELNADLLTSLTPQLDRRMQLSEEYLKKLQELVAANPKTAIIFRNGGQYEIGGKKLPTVRADQPYEVEGDPGKLVFFFPNGAALLSVNNIGYKDPHPLTEIRGQFRFFVNSSSGVAAVFEQPLPGFKGAYIPASRIWELIEPAVVIRLNNPYPHNQTLLNSRAYEYN